jgi:hypothetical protein
MILRHAQDSTAARPIKIFLAKAIFKIINYPGLKARAIDI